jgi:hypothetical protein
VDIGTDNDNNYTKDNDVVRTVFGIVEREAHRSDAIPRHETKEVTGGRAQVTCSDGKRCDYEPTFRGTVPGCMKLGWSLSRNPTLIVVIGASARNTNPVVYIPFDAKRRVRQLLRRENVPSAIALIVCDYMDRINQLQWSCGPEIERLACCSNCETAVLIRRTMEYNYQRLIKTGMSPLQALENAYVGKHKLPEAFICTTCKQQTCQTCVGLDANDNPTGRCNDCQETSTDRMRQL